MNTIWRQEVRNGQAPWSIVCCRWVQQPGTTRTPDIKGCNFTTYTQFRDNVAVFTFVPFLILRAQSRYL